MTDYRVVTPRHVLDDWNLTVGRKYLVLRIKHTESQWGYLETFVLKCDDDEIREFVTHAFDFCIQTNLTPCELNGHVRVDMGFTHNDWRCKVCEKKLD